MTWDYQGTENMIKTKGLEAELAIWITTSKHNCSKKTNKIMKGDKKRRKSGFKKGHKRYETEELKPSEAVSAQYVRPTVTEEDLMQDQPIFAEALSSNAASDKTRTESPVDYKFLRSHCNEPCNSTNEQAAQENHM